MTARTMSARSAWHIGVGAIGASWLLSAVVVALRGMLTSVDPWLPVHLLLLGAVSNAILVWSTYFTEALLRQPRAASRLVEAVRLGTFNVGAVAVMTHEPPGPAGVLPPLNDREGLLACRAAHGGSGSQRSTCPAVLPPGGTTR